MSIKKSFMLALSNILYDKMRSFLTMLGIIIGVGAVIILISLMDGMTNMIEDQFSEMGITAITVSTTNRGGSRTVDEDEIYALRDEHPELYAELSPTVSMMQATVKSGSDSSTTTTVTGVSEEYYDLKRLELMSGRFIQYLEVENKKKVCVIGTYINQSFFAGRGIGESIKIAGSDYKVIGIMEKKGDRSEYSADNCIFLPYSTVSRLSGKGNIDSFAVSFKDSNKAADAKKLIEDKLTEYFGSSDAFYVSSISEYLEEFTRMSNIMVTILTLIAGISLVVGGIGIMNIMLVSVTERTKEIGIRKALGAKERYILAQFVIEAGVTSALGGLIGIALGYLLSAAASQVIVRMFQQQMRVQPSINSVLLSFGISAGIGVFFGFMPAKKAAKLNPIDALRYD